MNTSIGRIYDNGAIAKCIWLLLLAFVFADLTLEFTDDQYYRWRDTLAFSAGMAYVLASVFIGARPFGLSFVPRQQWRYWIVVILVLGAVALTLEVAALLWIALGFYVPAHFQTLLQDRADFLPVMWWMCIQVPLVEEILYCACLCPPLVAF